MLDGPDPLGPYRQLEQLAERQSALLAAGLHDELPEVQADWTRIAVALPARPPADAEPLLHRALALVEQAQAQMRVARDEASQELARAGRERAVGRAYRPAESGPPDHRLDVSI